MSRINRDREIVHSHLAVRAQRKTVALKHYVNESLAVSDRTLKLGKEILLAAPVVNTNADFSDDRAMR